MTSLSFNFPWYLATYIVSFHSSHHFTFTYYTVVAFTTVIYR